MKKRGEADSEEAWNGARPSAGPHGGPETRPNRSESDRTSWPLRSVTPAWFRARFVAHDIYELSGEALERRGFKLLLADLDNTLVPYGVPLPDERLKAWRDDLNAHGVTLFVLSNNRHENRPRIFSEGLGVPGCAPFWWSPSGWRAIRGGICGTPWRSPSGCYPGKERRCERYIRPRGERGKLPL